MSKSFITNDPMLEMAKEQRIGHHPVNKFGHNINIGTTAEDIWDAGGVWVAPTQARVHNIVSTSANDAAAGSAARTLRIYGLTSWTEKEAFEDITLNGTNNVATTNAYVIIHRMKVLTTGSGDINVGTITATAVTDATVTAQISPGQGQTQMAIYGVPQGQTAYMMRMYASINKDSAGTGGVDIRLKACADPSAELSTFLTKHTQGIMYQGGSVLEHDFKPYSKFDGPTILKMTGIGSAINNDVSGGFDLILVDE